MKTLLLIAILVIIVLAAVLRMVRNVQKGNSFCGAVIDEPIRQQNTKQPSIK